MSLAAANTTGPSGAAVPFASLAYQKPKTLGEHFSPLHSSESDVCQVSILATRLFWTSTMALGIDQVCAAPVLVVVVVELRVCSLWVRWRVSVMLCSA